ncbi:hypothetical protein POSPLADRAFT_1076732, partial [Postia placenta MAD-698-R-SB12]
LGLFFPWLNLGYYCERSGSAPLETIFFFEGLATCAAIHTAATHLRQCGAAGPKRVAVFTDNSNTVGIFNSLRATPGYNTLLKSAVDVRLHFDIDVRVHHISGSDNRVADAISRRQFTAALALMPGLRILPFTPPRDALGA